MKLKTISIDDLQKLKQSGAVVRDNNGKPLFNLSQKPQKNDQPVKQDQISPAINTIAKEIVNIANRSNVAVGAVLKALDNTVESIKSTQNMMSHTTQQIIDSLKDNKPPQARQWDFEIVRDEYDRIKKIKARTTENESQ